MNAPTCAFRAPACTKPASGRCSLCQQLACEKHSDRKYHFNVLPLGDQ